MPCFERLKPSLLVKGNQPATRKDRVSDEHRPADACVGGTTGDVRRSRGFIVEIAVVGLAALIHNDGALITNRVAAIRIRYVAIMYNRDVADAPPE